EVRSARPGSDSTRRVRRPGDLRPRAHRRRGHLRRPEPPAGRNPLRVRQRYVRGAPRNSHARAAWEGDPPHVARGGHGGCTPPAPMASCDIAVIGASTGGIEALHQLLELLPRDLEAAVLAVIHIPDVPSFLPHTLSRNSSLPVRFARNRDRLVKGTVLIAPPNHHLLLESSEEVRLAQSARENGFRPAVDPLFRTAARCCGPRVMGIVLSGALDDGAAGLREIRQRGGVAIVQDFDEALFDSMPRAAATEADAQILTLR